jgi:hypothetical protein
MLAMLLCCDCAQIADGEGERAHSAQAAKGRQPWDAGMLGWDVEQLRAQSSAGADFASLLMTTLDVGPRIYHSNGTLAHRLRKSYQPARRKRKEFITDLKEVGD